MERIIGALRSVLQGAHLWCAPKLSLAACTCPGPRTRPRPASLTCPGRLVRNLRVRNITVHLGQRARLDRARTGRGAHRFHLGARAAPRAHRGARTTPRVAPWPVCSGAPRVRARCRPPARSGSAGQRTPGPARPPTRTQTGKRFIQIALRRPERKTKKGATPGLSREVTHPSTTPAQAPLNCGVLMGSGALTLV
ncbi:hypothetical protein SUGI_1406880 [Cryptomeria japonica]|uniref:Uncharacterized protein n=1 Tax=Cryptomeria japonica TaxID=3369 RepID=A0AAD3NU71_CRYJA|nr:hypothetical protein SUGI_1406880 [Cryptomeria japonica]